MAGLIVVFSALGGTTGSIITGNLFEAFGGTTAFYFSLLPISLILVSLYAFRKSIQRHDAQNHNQAALEPER
jgi:MFS-type transporter involved in bile tolerance (Atg22 family)